MNLETKIKLTFEEEVDVTQLMYQEMLYYMKHNVYIYVNVLYTVYKNKYLNYER